MAIKITSTTAQAIAERIWNLEAAIEALPESDQKEVVKAKMLIGHKLAHSIFIKGGGIYHNIDIIDDGSESVALPAGSTVIQRSGGGSKDDDGEGNP